MVGGAEEIEVGLVGGGQPLPDDAGVEVERGARVGALDDRGLGDVAGVPLPVSACPPAPATALVSGLANSWSIERPSSKTVEYSAFTEGRDLPVSIWEKALAEISRRRVASRRLRPCRSLARCAVVAPPERSRR